MPSVEQKRLVLLFVGMAGGVGLGLLISLMIFSTDRAELQTPPQAEARVPIIEPDELKENLATEPKSLGSVLEIRNAPKRRVALYQLIEDKNGEQIADLLRHSLTLDTKKHLFSVQNLLFTALARVDPEQSLEIVWQSERARRDEFLANVVKVWASMDPQSAMQAGSELEEPWRSIAFRTILQSRQDLSDEMATELAESVGAAAVLSELSYSAQVQELIDEPRAAFNYLLSADLPDSRKSELVSLITKRWIEREGTGKEASMLSLVYEVFAEEQNWWRPIVATLAAADPKSVWKELSTLSVDAQKMLNDEIFRVWVKQDPMEALEALSQSDDVASEGRELNPLYALWASAIWDQLPEKIGLVPINHRANMLREAVGHVATRLEPIEILSQLEKLNGAGVNTKSAVESFSLLWGAKNPDSALQWALEHLEPGHYVIPILLMGIAQTDVSKAMEIALEQPASSGAERSVVSALFSEGRLEQGLEFLPLVREGMHDAYLYSSAGELLIDNGRTTEAVALAKELPKEMEIEYFERLADRWRYKGFYSFVPVLSQLPSEEIRSHVAEYILRIDSRMHSLTDDETDIVRSFVLENSE